MKNHDIALLGGEINESVAALDKIDELYQRFGSVFRDVERREIRDAVILAEILCNTYTCLETIFFRVARLFENHLDAHQWHKELLHKMRIDIPGVRKALLSEATYALLDELRRFRHFRRYYYAFEYDWAKLDYLRSVYERLGPMIRRELADYIRFLDALANPAP